MFSVKKENILNEFMHHANAATQLIDDADCSFEEILRIIFLY